MSNAPSKNPCILVASDNSTDAALVQELLTDEFPGVQVSIQPDNAATDFERTRPDVLVLAFNALEKAERYYLGLCRLSKSVYEQPHRTVILCSKEEVKRVSELCMKQHFDDYVLFWPMSHDAPRLSMAVHLALRELSALSDEAGPTAAEFAVQARRLAELEELLDEQTALGGRRVDTASQAISQAGEEIGAALDDFSHRLGSGALADVVEVRSAEGLGREIARMKREQIDQSLRAISETMQPVRRWVDELKQECAPQLASARALSAMADQVRPIVLMVDDDDILGKLVAKTLESANYQLVLARSGSEAMSVLRKTRPDVILMDVLMPEIDGLEVTRRLKAIPRFAGIPVIMVTGKSAGSAVAESLKAGASDFVVKPFDRDTLLAKLARVLQAKAHPLTQSAG